MAKIIFNDVTLRYPVFNSRSMSLRNQLVRIATGGTIENESGHATVITALKNLSFSLESGDAVGVIGHNGAGKSTLLRTMAGIYQPESGSIYRKGNVATVLEIGAGLEAELSGYENIINLGMMMGMSLQEARAIIPDVEEFTELGDFLQLPVRTYSSGMTMRLMFAVATAITPEILLLDEMFSTGDAGFQEKSLSRIKKLISSAQIFIFASHDKELIKTYCNRIFRLEHGELQEIPYETFT
jgi:ABC-type polysaccharide/polyol phosphate transport system ATPase subunit